MRGDAVDALEKCAEALQDGNPRLANAEMGRVLALAEEETDLKTRRLIGYFAQALACRAYARHPKYFSFPSSVRSDTLMVCGDCPFYIAGWTISSVLKGKRKVHVIALVKHMDFYMDWLAIFYGDLDLGDLTHLRLSFLVQKNVEFPKESEEFFRTPKHLPIEFEYKSFPVNSFADIDVSLLGMRDDEFVVVNCMFVFSKI